MNTSTNTSYASQPEAAAPARSRDDMAFHEHTAATLAAVGIHCQVDARPGPATRLEFRSPRDTERAWAVFDRLGLWLVTDGDTALRVAPPGAFILCDPE